MVDLMQQHVDGAKKLADEAGLEKAPKILYVSANVRKDTNGQNQSYVCRTESTALQLHLWLLAKHLSDCFMTLQGWHRDVSSTGPRA